MRRLVGALVGALVLTAHNPAVQAQGKFSVIQRQTQSIGQAVQRNVERIFRPKLVVAEGATGGVSALALTGDEHTLVSAVGNNTVRVWDLWVGQEVARLKGHQARIAAVAVASDGSRAVTVGEDRLVKVWNLRNLGEVTNLGQHPTTVTDVAIAASGARLVTAADDGHVRLWSLPDGRIEREFAAHDSGATHARFLPGGTTLVTAGADGHLRIWDLSTGQKVADLDGGAAITALAVNADGNMVAAGTRRGKIHIWRPDGGDVASFSGDSTKITSIAFSPKVAGLLIGDDDGAIRFWPYLRGGDTRELGKHDKAVTQVIASRVGEMALSASEDGTTRLWNLNSGSTLLRLISTQAGWAVIDAKGRYDGNQDALDGIEWQADDNVAKVEDFAETHYEAALLPRTVAGGANIADVSSIPDGVPFPAKVEIKAENEPTRQRRVTVEVVAADDGGGVAEIRLYRNGKLIPGNAGEVVKRSIGGKDELVGRYDVELGPGRNTLSATAVNAERLESRPKRVVVDAGAAIQLTGKLHLVVVGINRYDQKSLQLWFARRDAESISRFLTAPNHVPLPIAEVIPLIDEGATKAHILETLGKLRSVPPEDVVVLYMAGHGVSVGDEWYFISQEIHIPADETQLAGVALSAQDIKAAMEAMAAERTLVLIDTCNSGAAVSPLNDYRGLKSLRLMARTVGTHVLAATDRNQYALEIPELRHGVFTYALLAALGGKAARPDGLVTAKGLIQYVQEEVPALVSKYPEYPQYPTGYSRGTDFAVAGRGAH
ncbi:putative Wd40 repeat, subgroup [Magnetospirillum sp. XM-1]|uniref:caspase family protein n=1 Tax=Magnetospirillum sp. XM-1 TaxID=1663591 RepID=UPI00073DC749|nr:caspase family protein [Magnetospirillum sp. XM-1]CUW39628.1 putative Wd40 repeat, subgroup [Magnetospirillum sp. XM-1]